MKIPVYRSADNGVEVFVGHAHMSQVSDPHMSQVSDLCFDDEIEFDPDKEQYVLVWSWVSPGFGAMKIERIVLRPKGTRSEYVPIKDREREWYEMKVKLFDHMVERQRKDLEETEAMRNHYVAKLAELVLGGRV